MKHTPHFLLTDPAEVKALIRAHPWATIVSATSAGLVGSHYPVMLDESADQITLLGHMGRPDDSLHELGQHEVLVIIQGPHDYVSPSWYGTNAVVPTWNHVTAHLYGTPEVLGTEENYAALSDLTDLFEQHEEHGRRLADDEEYTRRLALGTAGFRLEITRFEARAKLSQNKPAAVRDRVIEKFDATHPELAEQMRRHDPDRP